MTEYVVRVSEYRLAPDNRPPGCEAAGIGAFRIRGGARFDPHFHDAPEYWLIYEGKAKVSVGDRLYHVQAGDVVCTPTGAVHDIVEVYEELEAFYVEESPPPGGRHGHLHRDERDASGHRIPLAELPEDFPAASRAGVFGAEHAP
jgi:mannose-6-phosphate isomerase-like protein (cupin superfamily)